VVANTWGFVDLLNALRSAVQLNVPSFNLATLWYIYTFYAPLVVVAHVMPFWLLLRSQRASASSLSLRNQPPDVWSQLPQRIDHGPTIGARPIQHGDSRAGGGIWPGGWSVFTSALTIRGGPVLLRR
jgi:hypothetical protein